MDKFCIVVADGAKARWLCLEDAPGASGRTTHRLLESAGLVNLESELTGSALELLKYLTERDLLPSNP
jgi:hypothetical protein